MKAKIFSQLRAGWEWFKLQAQSKNAPLAVAVWSFLNPLLIPFPAESLLAPIALANRKRALYLTALASIMTTLGAGVGYFLSAFLYDAFVAPFVGSDITNALNFFAGNVEPLALFGIVFIAALTLLPDPPFIAAAGLLHVDFILFMVAFFLGRTLRFALVVGIVVLFGKQTWNFVEYAEKHFFFFGVLFVLLLLFVLAVVI